MLKVFLMFVLLLIAIGCHQMHLLPDSNVPEDSFFRITTVCIEGHVYYQARHINEGCITPKLDDNGKPYHCTVDTTK